MAYLGYAVKLNTPVVDNGVTGSIIKCLLKVAVDYGLCLRKIIDSDLHCHQSKLGTDAA